MKKAVIIRWRALAQREMQNYAPLQEDSQWQVLGIGSKRPDHDLGLIATPVAQPRSLDTLLMGIPGFDPIAQRLLKLRPENLNYYFKLDDYVRDATVVDVAETFHIFGLQVAQAKARYGFKLVVSVQENIPFTHENLEVRRKTKRMIFEQADHFFALSGMARESLVLEGADRSKISVVPAMGVDAQKRFVPAPKSTHWLRTLNLAADDMVVLFVGRLVWSKGIHDLLSAFAVLKQRGVIAQSRAKLLIVGDGEEKSALVARIQRLGLGDSVKLLDRVAYADMPAIHNLADIFVLPSIATPKWQEQFGAVLAESMACARPVIGASSGSIPEVIGNAGLIAQANDYLSLADQLACLMGNESMRRHLGQAGRQRVLAEYDSSIVSSKIRAVFEQLAKEKTP